MITKEKEGRKITCDYKLEYNLNEIDCGIEQKNGTLRCYGEKFKAKRNRKYNERNRQRGVGVSCKECPYG